MSSCSDLLVLEARGGSQPPNFKNQAPCPEIATVPCASPSHGRETRTCCSGCYMAVKGIGLLFEGGERAQMFPRAFAEASQPNRQVRSFPCSPNLHQEDSVSQKCQGFLDVPRKQMRQTKNASLVPL